MRRRFALTHVDRDGLRVLTFANLSHYFRDSRAAAEQMLAVYGPELRAKVLHGQADTLEVREVPCYDHGEAMVVVLDE